MSVRKVSLALVACAGLAACGDTIGEQALGGAAVGAGAAVLTNDDIGKGAAVGAAGNVGYCAIYPARCN